MAPVHYHAGRFPPDAVEWDRLIPLIGPAAIPGKGRRATVFAFPALLNLAEGREVF
jgi:hypothetical protein